MPKDLNKPFIQRLYDSKNLDEKFTALELEVTRSGFDGVLYTFIPKLSRLTDSLKPVFQCSENYTPVLEHYKKHDYIKHDFIIKLAEKGKLDIIDRWAEAEKIQLTEKEEEVNKSAKEDFSITKSILFPTLIGDMGIAGVNIISFKQEYANKTIDPKLLNHLKTCCKTYHDYTMVHQDTRYEFILPLLESLTPKKKVVLKYLITGQPMKNIAEEADITTRYAEKLLVELRKDFGDISINELIYFLGLLNITEYL